MVLSQGSAEEAVGHWVAMPLRYLVSKDGGFLQYGNDTPEEAYRRYRRMLAHNLRLDRLLQKNGRPMPAMRAWAKRRGINQTSDATLAAGERKEVRDSSTPVGMTADLVGR